MWKRIADLWCRKMHNDDAMWPIHGKYICKRCLREYTVTWEGPIAPGEHSSAPMENENVIDSRVWLADER
jgi:hypothetical protein